METYNYQAEEPGRRLRQVREILHLKYRDVEEASHTISRQRCNQEYSIGLSRLADIENKGTVPSLFRMYSLCVIYGLAFGEVLQWYGIDLNNLAADCAKVESPGTRLLNFDPQEHSNVEVPAEVDESTDLKRTFYLTPHVRRWGRLPLSLLKTLDLRKNRYAFIGTEDWFMYPTLAPGAFIQIDETKKRIVEEDSTEEHNRPIYFIEHRNGYRCGWCTETRGFIVVQPPAASHASPEIFKYPGDADVIGQVVGVAMRLDLGKKRRTRFSEDPK